MSENYFRQTLDTASIINEQLELINERQIIAGRGAKYGQVIFFAGGGGSGKGFAIKNLVDSRMYKVIDVDEWKQAYLKLNALTKRYPELEGLNLRDPVDVSKLHVFVKNKGIKDATLNMIFRPDRNREVLPNIVFDMVGKEAGDFTQNLHLLNAAGYKPENIHVIWVFAPYLDALADNKKRSRVVDEKILFDAHSHVPGVIMKFIKQGFPSGIDGDFFVVDAARSSTKFHDRKSTGAKASVVSDFKYVRLKTSGKPMAPPKSIVNLIVDMIKDYAPRTKSVWEPMRGVDRK